jgi:dTDP-4-dehydrorhamnose reductase
MGHRVICIGRGGLGKAFEDRGIFTLSKSDVDITDVCSLNAMFDEQRPRFVINCAGVVGTGKCSLEPEYTNMVNVGGVANIVYMCKKYGASLAHMSTFYCGKHNVYTSSKDMAEDIVMSANIEKLVVRLPWIFGKYTENFISDLRKGKKCGIFPGERGYLAYDEDICDYVIDNIGNTGIHAIANDGALTREDIVDYFKGWGLVKKLERKISMPNCEQIPTVRMRHWKEAMEDFIHGTRAS